MKFNNIREVQDDQLFPSKSTTWLFKVIYFNLAEFTKPAKWFKGCTAYGLIFSEFQKNQLLLQIFPKIDKRMKFPKVMFSVNVVVRFV